MSSTFEDSVFDFDFNFLQQTTKNNVVESKIEKQRKAILIAKRKTIATDSLIKKYYAKKETLDQTEKYLIASKEECKQVCIKYNTAFERCTKLEKEAQSLYQKSQELQERLNYSENQCKAIQSHANQLQVLVREHETQIECLKIENQLEKSNTKEQTKSVLLNKNESDVLVNHICLLRDIVLGKTKLRKRHKIILQKYDKYKLNVNTNDASATNSSDDEIDVLENSTPSPIYPDISKNNTAQVVNACSSNEVEKNINSGYQITNSIDGDYDSDSGNEFISEDTGCGSSLACTDTEKCFNSPDYFITDSPFSNTTNKEKKNYADTATSPITVHKVQEDVATSPIAFTDTVFNNITFKKHVATSPITTSNMQVEVATSPIAFTDKNIFKKHVATNLIMANNAQVEVATSPIAFTDRIFNNSALKKHVGTSPNTVNKAASVIATRPFIDESKNKASPIGATDRIVSHQTENKEICIPVDNSDFVLSTDVAPCPIEFPEPLPNSNLKNTYNLSMEQECLEVNNSNILNNSLSYDCEVDTILNTMRFDHELITPIPKTPARNAETVQATCGNVCQEAARVGEENEILKASISDLAKEISNIKSLLKNHLLFNENENHNSSQDRNNIGITMNTSITAESLNKSSENTNYMDNEAGNASENLIQNSQQRIPELEKLETDLTQYNVEITDQFENEVCRDEIINQDCLYKSPIKVIEKLKRIKKITRLEKLRKKMLPKSKIRRAKTPPIRKMKRKKLLFKKNNLEAPSVVALNNKTAYEKAVKLMAEFKIKEKNNIKNSPTLNALNKTIERSDRQNKPVVHECDGNKDDNPENCITSLTNVNPLVDISDVNKVTSVSEEYPQSYSVSPNLSVTISDVNNFTSESEENPQTHLILPNLPVTTRSRSKRLSSVLSDNTDNDKQLASDILQEGNSDTTEITEARKRIKRVASDKSEVTTKRLLRSSNALNVSSANDLSVKSSDNEISEIKNNDSAIINNRRSSRLSTSKKNVEIIIKDSEDPKLTDIVTYSDLDIFSENISPSKNHRNENNISDKLHPKENILCKMLEKYAKNSVRYSVKKIPESTINSICKKVEESIAHILTVPHNETKLAMNNFVNEIQSWNMRNFLAGLMKYLKDPARKDELFNKVSAPPAPHMTKSEQVLIYILKQLQNFWPSVDFVEIVLANIEFALFQLNHTPEFGTVESLAHFYAVICRYFRVKSRLRLFILDAMYCIQYKSVALIKQCLEVWMHILPLAHMGIAKSPLVTCLVYLLHFFKCDDKFNRVQEIRDILSRKYFYQVTEWTETKILEMFKNAIKELRDIPVEKKMLRMSLIILAKRRGPQWCQKNLIKNMLQPLIEKEDVPDKVKEFCVSVLGPLLKPYPNDMKVHCEIVVNQLLEMLDRNGSPSMKEAIFSSLLYMRRHNQGRVTQALLLWNPQHVSPELEQLLKDYVREKPAKVWRNMLSRISVM